MMKMISHEQQGNDNSPVVAILAMHDEWKPFRGNSQNFADLIETGKQHGVNIYVVTPRELQLNQRQVLAFAYHKNTNAWIPE